MSLLSLVRSSPPSAYPSSSFLHLQTQSIKDGEQKRYRHTLDAVRTIYRTEGLQAFYKGLTPSLMGVSHVAVQFPLYEQLKIWAGESGPVFVIDPSMGGVARPRGT